METKGSTISRVRQLIKGMRNEAFLTDQFLYSMVFSTAKLFIKRKDDSYKLGRNSSLFQKLPGVGLEEISKIEAGCIDIETNCTFKRTKTKLPPIIDGCYGPMIRWISSVDSSKSIIRTDAKTYASMTRSSTFKYNKNQYYWLSDDYAYFPELEWDEIDIDAMWENDITEFRCDAEDCCVDRLTERTNIPEDLFVEIEDIVQKKLMGMIQIPQDKTNDNQSLQRS